jgi:phosphoglycerate dehydrogenase-like enzyme
VKELREIIADYYVIIAITKEITFNVLKSLNKIEIISRVGTCVNNIDIILLNQKLIFICILISNNNAKLINYESIS